MTTYLCTATIPMTSNLPEDAVQMQFPLMGPNDYVPSNSDTLDWAGPISQFISDAGGAFSPFVSRAAGAVELQLYDLTGHLDGSPHGSPVAIDTCTIFAASPTADALPSEVAIAITLRGFGWNSQPVEAPDGGDLGNAFDRPRQRRRGLMYLGPLNLSAADTVGNRSRPSGPLITALLGMTETLQDGLAANGWTWAVWSRKNAAVYAVVRTEIDNAFDTQRRRGIAPSARSVRTFTA